MATIRLGRYEAQQGDFPPVCIRCGLPACVYRRRAFDQNPWWMYLTLALAVLPFFILAVFLSKRVVVCAPLCQLHKDHWRWRSLVLFAAVAVNAFGWLAALSVVTELFVRFQAAYDFGMFVLMFTTLIGPVFLTVLALVLQLTAVRATRVTDTGVTLAGVAPEFIEALRVEEEAGAIEGGPVLYALTASRKE
jgi:hypothetical protein